MERKTEDARLTVGVTGVTVCLNLERREDKRTRQTVEIIEQSKLPVCPKLPVCRYCRENTEAIW